MQTFSELYRSRPWDSFEENSKRRNEHLQKLKAQICNLERKFKTLYSKNQLQMMRQKALFGLLNSRYPLNEKGVHNAEYYKQLSLRESAPAVWQYQNIIEVKKSLPMLNVQLAKSSISAAENAEKLFMNAFEMAKEAASSHKNQTWENSFKTYLSAGDICLETFRTSIDNLKEVIEICEKHITFNKEYEEKLRAYVYAMI